MTAPRQRPLRASARRASRAVLRGSEAGMRLPEIVETFDVSPSQVRKARLRLRRIGLAPERRGRDLDPAKRRRQARVLIRCAEAGMPCSFAARRLGISRQHACALRAQIADRVGLPRLQRGGYRRRTTPGACAAPSTP